ncbi:restriction endonuclease subunit S [Streptomyces zaehneri]|uniref:restriction endonuclease subunit S n=1 Tax=Streptomyces zaehneri TaxID=3051180 RepID=UPI0028D04369|nr:restriction endonuclease subunit S [Streptomyces sp. DSM 40713]
MTDACLPYGSALPGTWAAVPLKYLATLTNGYVFNSGQRSDTGTPIIRIENLNGSSRFNHSELSLPNRYRVDSGDLLFSWSGNPGTSFGPYLWTKHGKHYLNQHIFKVGVFGCDPRWLYWALMAATRWIERELTSGMIGMVHVTKEDLSGVPIPVPPVEVQRRIADFLDAETANIERLIQLQQQVMQRLDERESAQLDSAIDNLMNEWGTVPLRRFLLGMEQGTSPQADAFPAGPNEWGVLKVSCLRPERFFPDENKQLPAEIKPDPRHEVREGDLLITRANTPQLVGSTAVVPHVRSKLLLSDKIFRVRLDARISAEFVATLARGRRIRDLCAAASNGASQSMANIRFEEVKGWPIPAAPLDAQLDLVKRVGQQRSNLDALRDKVARQATLLAERRQALITAAVTGQFDVSTASGRNVTEGLQG